MNKIKRYQEMFFSAITVLFIVLAIYYKADLFPFGTKALNWGDMAQQNFPILLQFRDVMLGKQGTMFSMVNAGGMDFTAMFLFLASSPFSLFSVFISKENLIFYINIMIVLKFMLSGVTASICFKRFFNKLTSLQIVALSVSYALCGYAMLFYQLDTWLDVMYMFPLLIIAFNMLVTEYKLVPYVVCLSLMILFQFYLGYMIAIFLIIIFALYILLAVEKEKRKKATMFFGIGSFLSVLICSPVLAMALSQYLTSARETSILQSLVSSETLTALPTTLSFLFCTSIILAVPLIIFFFNVLKNKKVLVLFITYILLLIPVVIEPINKMWHTGSYQAFPVRYGYITVFLGLLLAAVIISKANRYSAIKTKKYSTLYFVISCILLVEFYYIIIRLIENENDILKSYATTLWSSNSFLGLYVFYALSALIVIISIFVFYSSKKISKTVFSVFLCIFVVGECLFNSMVFVANGARSTINYKDSISLSEKIDDDSTYRVKVKKKYFDVNLVGAMGYNSLAHYTSLINSDYIYTMKKLGYSSYWMEVNSNGSTDFVDALLGNKYTINNFFFINDNEDIVYKNKVYNIVKNKNNLSLGNVISAHQVKELQDINNSDRIESQQMLYEIFTDREEDFITKYDYTSTNGVDIEKIEDSFVYTVDNIGTIKYDIDVKGKQKLYFDCFCDLTTHLTEPHNSSFNICVNGYTLKKSYPSKTSNGMICLGEFENEKVSVELITLKSGKVKSFGVFGMDMNELEKGINTFNQADVKVSGNDIIVNADSKNLDEYLLLTIPYSKGFDVTVNGEDVKAIKTLGTFMAIPLKQGQNKIVLEYSSYGWQFIIVSIIGIGLLIFLSLRFKKKGYKSRPNLEKFILFSFWCLSILTVVVIYVFPMAIHLVTSIIY